MLQQTVPDLDRIMSFSDAELIDKLNIEVSNLTRESFGGNFMPLQGAPERIDRRYSFMFRYMIGEIGGTPRFLLVKIPHQSWMKTINEAVASEQIRAEVKFEYDVMKSIAKVISNSGESQLCAINPVGCLINLNALVTEEIRLVMLKDYLVKIPIMMGNKASWNDFIKSLRLAGIWLKVVHKSYSTGREVALESLDVFGLVTKELTLLGKINFRLMDLLRTKFKDLYDLIKNEKISISSAHDDYHLGNIFVTDEGKVGVLDPNWKDDRPIYGDLSKLIIDPATRKIQVALGGLSFRTSLQVIYEREILAGYSGTKSLSEAVLWFYCAFAVLEKWVNNEEIMAGSKPHLFFLFRPFLRIQVRHYFSKLIYDYLDRGMRAVV